MKPFKATVEKTDDIIIFNFDGVLNENAVIPVLPKDDISALVVNWDGVSHINSVGIAIWVKWFKNFRKEQSKAKVTFQNCTRVVVNQMSSINGFFPRGTKVESFYVPHYCEACDYHHKVLYKAGGEFTYDGSKVKIAPPQLNCEKCGGDLEFDVLSEQYFAFFEN